MGEYKLWLRTESDERVLAWQGNGEGNFRRNLEILEDILGLPVMRGVSCRVREKHARGESQLLEVGQSKLMEGEAMWRWTLCVGFFLGAAWLFVQTVAFGADEAPPFPSMIRELPIR